MNIELIHIAGAAAATLAAGAGLALGTGRLNPGNLVNLSREKGPGHLSDQAKKRIDANADDGEELSVTEKQAIAREVDHIVRRAYSEGKREGEMKADNEDKQFKAVILTMAFAGAAFLFQLGQYFGLV